jgi:hypothetical protein
LCENWQDWKEDNLSYENLVDSKIAVGSVEQFSQTHVTKIIHDLCLITMTHKCMMVDLCGTCYVT